MFDLTDGGGSSPVVNKRIDTVILKYAFPFRTYGVTIHEEVRVLPPLSLPPQSVGAKTSSQSDCKQLEKLYDNIKAFATKADPAKKEKDLKDSLIRLQKALEAIDCDDTDLKQDMQALINACMNRKIDLPNPVKMQYSSNYTFTITGDKTVYVYKFEGKDRGRWLVNYGFMFSSKRLERDRYYLNKIGNDSFQITKKASYSIIDLRFTPTVFFSWFLDKNLNRDWNNSLSMGVGFNTQSPVISIGYNGMYNQNIGFSAGIAFYEQERLNGKYKENQTLKENLEEAQLYEKDFFRPNFFIALNIRLGESPFKNSSSSNPPSSNQ